MTHEPQSQSSSQPTRFDHRGSLRGWIDRGQRTRLTLAGPDRIKALNNLLTNDIKKLKVGTGCEAFVTSLQGKTLGYLTVLAAELELWLLGSPPLASSIVPHLQKYTVFEQVELIDRTATTGEIHLLVDGDDLESLARLLGFTNAPATPLAHQDLEDGSLILREAPTGQVGLTVIAESGRIKEIQQLLTVQGLEPLDPQRFEAARIRQGTPEFGRDVKPENLPQELQRDDLAISFVKGCYIGQETVARIDALGHVNKVLRGLLLESDDRRVPADGTPLILDGKPVGVVTSAVLDAEADQVIGLGYVRGAFATPGTLLQWQWQDTPLVATVVALPNSAD